MSKADEIMINCFGNLEATTAGIYYKPLKEIIETIEKRQAFNIKEYIIFCSPLIKEQAKQIAKYYKIKCKTTLFLPEDTLAILGEENIFKKFKNTYDIGWIGGEDE